MLHHLSFPEQGLREVKLQIEVAVTIVCESEVLHSRLSYEASTILRKFHCPSVYRDFGSTYLYRPRVSNCRSVQIVLYSWMFPFSLDLHAAAAAQYLLSFTINLHCTSAVGKVSLITKASFCMKQQAREIGTAIVVVHLQSTAFSFGLAKAHKVTDSLCPQTLFPNRAI